MYRVHTIGDLSGGLKGQPWLDMPPGWVPAGTPDLPGVKAPVPGPPLGPLPPTTDGLPLVAAVVGGVAVALAGVWAWSKYRKGRR